MSAARLGAICCASCLALCCGEPAPVAPGSGTPGAAGPEVVARVDGEPVHASDLQVLHAHGDRRRALREALRFELLAQEARRRGLHRRPEVERMRKRALANLFVRRAFGERFTERSIPAHLVRRAYELNWMQYDRPPLVRMAYLFLPLAQDAPAAQRALARQLVERTHARLRARPRVDLAEFDRLAGEAVGEALRAGLRPSLQKLTVERLKGGPKKAAVDAAFALRPGRFSAPLRSESGYYVVYTQELLPELRRPLAQVEGEVRRRIFAEARELAFEELVAGLERERKVQVNPEALRLLEERGEGAR